MRLARLLIQPLARSWMTPNHLTALGLVTGLAAGFLYALGTRPAIDLAAGLFIIAAVLDHADGELARVTDQHTRFGYYFDHISGAVNYIALFTGMGIGLRNSTLGEWAIPSGVIVGVSISVIFALRFEIERRQGKDTFKQPHVAGFEVEDIMYLIGPITWLGGLLPFLALSAIGAPVFALWLTWQGATSWGRKPRKRAKT